ncbi:MAG: bacillithiol biosynthesis deacetylase BshB1 [Bacteroidota bacterium]|nr:bacillithiol biosynthesis deacetylase BshB1 [Bacteroidota bacterium]
MIDILAIGIHPDDVELSCSGTLLKHIAAGYSAGILDLTKGELGTRGSAELRLKEAAAAAKILGVQFRENLGMEDGFFKNDRINLYLLVEKIRQHRPKIVLCNAVSDRHPDHGRASEMVSEACFYSGLAKIETAFEKEFQLPHRPQAVYHYIQDRQLKADLVVDITPFIDKKIEAIMAFSSQFYDPKSTEPVTPISSPEFMEMVKAKMRVYGRDIQVEFAEGFTVERTIGVEDLVKIR